MFKGRYDNKLNINVNDYHDYYKEKRKSILLMKFVRSINNKNYLERDNTKLLTKRLISVARTKIDN